ncbi:MAG: molybdopterin cofactor-binding domain-containing protein [Actinomycetes bacterium]
MPTVPGQQTGQQTGERNRGGVGQSAARPDGVPKVTGEFAFSSDLLADGMLWGSTLRSPYPSARIVAIDVGPALAVAGVSAVVTAEDVPGASHFGLEDRDQPVFAADVVRHCGEAVAAVAADHPETARRAAQAIRVTYEPLDPLTDPEAALSADPIHPDGNVFRHIDLRHGDVSVTGDVVVEGRYEVGMQDQAFMGPESGLAVPADDHGVDIHISTQWLHVDRDQVADCLGLAPEQVRVHLAGVGGAFGAREDLSMQVHLALLALRTGRPVKMVFSREESFLGHVHRHPARMWYRHHATRDGRLVKVEARLVLDGGAYMSSSRAVISNAVCFAPGPYVVPAAHVEGWAVRTNNPPCGAMRGFGAVQVCYGHESQMDRLAAALGMDPVELRLRNALSSGDRLVTGQVVRGTAPVTEVIRSCATTPLPPVPTHADPMALPGGAGRTAERADVRRGVGFAVSFKNLMYSEGFDDYSTARVRLEDGVATVTCAASEVGQGFVTLAQQITRELLEVSDVVVAPAETASIGSAGSTSASRQTWMSGGAVAEACRRVRRRLDAGEPQPLEETVEFHHGRTMPLDEHGQGDAHVSFAFAAHRAVVDVDPDLGLVRVVEVATAQDVGRVLNPLQVTGQIEGGIAQGVGLAVMEEVVVDDGVVRNPSFTDYLIPTALDMPEIRVAALIEEPEPDAPFGAKGVGEPPTISSPAAVAAAVRDATGLELTRIPIRPQDVALRPAAPA